MQKYVIQNKDDTEVCNSAMTGRWPTTKSSMAAPYWVWLRRVIRRPGRRPWVRTRCTWRPGPWARWLVSCVRWRRAATPCSAGGSGPWRTRRTGLPRWSMGENRGFTAQTRDEVAAEGAEARADSEAAGVPPGPGGATLLVDMGPGATAAVARATPATAAVATETRKGNPYSVVCFSTLVVYRYMKRLYSDMKVKLVIFGIKWLVS